jgi:hypothetical protein
VAGDEARGRTCGEAGEYLSSASLNDSYLRQMRANGWHVELTLTVRLRLRRDFRPRSTAAHSFRGEAVPRALWRRKSKSWMSPSGFEGGLEGSGKANTY